MPGYVIKVDTDAILGTADLERLEDVVYDVLVDEAGSSTAVDEEGIGITDVEATFN